MMINIVTSAPCFFFFFFFPDRQTLLEKKRKKEGEKEEDCNTRHHAAKPPCSCLNCSILFEILSIEWLQPRKKKKGVSIYQSYILCPYVCTSSLVLDMLLILVLEISTWFAKWQSMLCFFFFSSSIEQLVIKKRERKKADILGWCWSHLRMMFFFKAMYRQLLTWWIICITFLNDNRNDQSHPSY